MYVTVRNLKGVGDLQSAFERPRPTKLRSDLPIAMPPNSPWSVQVPHQAVISFFGGVPKIIGIIGTPNPSKKGTYNHLHIRLSPEP